MDNIDIKFSLLQRYASMTTVAQLNTDNCRLCHRNALLITATTSKLCGNSQRCGTMTQAVIINVALNTLL